MTTFDNRDQARHALQRGFAQWSVASDEFTELLAEACLDAFGREQPASAHVEGTRHMVAHRYWVIRNEDIKFYAECCAAVTALASSPSLSSLAPHLLVAWLGSAFAFYRRLKNKGIYVTIDQCQILMALRAEHRPMLVSQLAREVDMPEHAVREILSELTKARCGDGTVVAIVSEDGAKCWACAGI